MMKPLSEPGPRQQPAHSSFWPWCIFTGFVLIALIAILMARQREPKPAPSPTEQPAARSTAPRLSLRSFRASAPADAEASDTAHAPSRTAEQIVAEKVKLFGRNRHDIVRRISQHSNKSVPADVEKFFELLDAGDWDAIKAQYHEIAKRAGRYDYSTSHDADADGFWRPVQEAFGAAEQAQLWPAQQLLDYGNAVLDSLRPGMVYVGGTDGGCFIPTMLNETSDGEHHVVLTQNALADQSYGQYLSFLYGDQLSLPSADDTARAFQEYTEDARARLLHDQQFPDEPKQVKPGENITLNSDGQAQVSGQVAVMTINGLLLQNILNQNPNLSFALEESFPLPATYTGAAPLGPVFELRASDAQTPLTADAANRSLDYWSTMAQQLEEDPASGDSDAGLKTWSHDLTAEAHLFAASNLSGQAEQAYQLATQLSPGNLEATYNYVELLVSQNRLNDAAQAVDSALKAAPNNQQLEAMAQQLARRQSAAH